MILAAVTGMMLVFSSPRCGRPVRRPSGVAFRTDTLRRIGHRGDNWCITWCADGSQVVSMDDGNWLRGEYAYHNRLYRIVGGPGDFVREEVSGYPRFTHAGEGWFGYGVCSVNGTLYSMVSRTPGENWDGPFRGVKMLKSTDGGESWNRVNGLGQERPIAPWDDAAQLDTKEEMFFLEEYGRFRDGEAAYPFAFCAFVQEGRDHRAARDGHVYIYSPEGAESHRLLLARVPAGDVDDREAWTYFSGWEGGRPSWSGDMEDREAVHAFPEKNGRGEYFGWYSWLPSVVWNPGLGLYIMTSGGTYAGRNLTGRAEDYFDRWMHTRTGSLGFWYAENPWGPWTEFFYTEHWIVDDERNRTYQPKLSPAWIGPDGRTMVLIWSDAMKNEEGRSHTVNYLWNQMEIEILVPESQRGPVPGKNP